MRCWIVAQIDIGDQDGSCVVLLEDSAMLLIGDDAFQVLWYEDQFWRFNER